MPKMTGLPIATRRRDAKDKARLQGDPKVLDAWENLKTKVGVTKFITDGETDEYLLIAHYGFVCVARAIVIGVDAARVEADLLHAQLLDYVKNGRRS
jgi:hypothetical protein